MKLFVLVLALALLPAIARAQTPTKLPLRQLQAPNVNAGPTGTCVVMFVNLQAACAVLPAGVTIASYFGVPLLVFPSPAAGPTEVFNEDYTVGAPAAGTSTQTAFPLVNTPLAGTVRVYLNGLRMSPGTDYAISGNTVTFTAGSAPQAGDAIAFDYQH